MSLGNEQWVELGLFQALGPSEGYIESRAGLCSNIKSPAHSMSQHGSNFSQCCSICLNIIANSFYTSALGLSQFSFSVSGECSALWVLTEAFFPPLDVNLLWFLRPSELTSLLHKDLENYFRKKPRTESNKKRLLVSFIFFLWFLLSFQFQSSPRAPPRPWSCIRESRSWKDCWVMISVLEVSQPLWQAAIFTWLTGQAEIDEPLSRDSRAHSTT